MYFSTTPYAASRTLSSRARGRASTGASLVLALCAGLSTGCETEESPFESFDAGVVTPLPNTPVSDGAVPQGNTDSSAPQATNDGGNVTPGTNGGGTAWCNAKAALETRCNACHDGKGTAGTPMGFTSYADLTADAPGYPGKKVWERVMVRIDAQKAAAEGKSVMPPQNNLSAEHKAALEAWGAAGAPEGDDPTCANAGDGGNNGRPKSIWDPSLCDDIYTLRAHDGAGGKFKVPYTPSNPDFYDQIPFDAPWGNETVQIINTRPLTDNGRVLHHWILYDRAGPFITGWAPGDDERQPLPPDVGMKVPSGSNSLYLDMHYYNTTGAAAEDESGVELCVVKGANLRKYPAGITMGFSKIIGLSIPANNQLTKQTATCTVNAKEPVKIMTASPHAHKYARHMRFYVEKANGQTITMLDAPFLFGEQASYPLEKEVLLETGDKVITECTFQNDSNATVTFGEGNGDEMCFNFASYYPVGGFCCNELGVFQSCLGDIFGGFGGFGQAN